MLENSIDNLVLSAHKYIEENGICLLLFDVINSRKLSCEDRYDLQKRLKTMISDLNSEFSDYFPIHDIAVFGRYEKGFEYLLGDGSWCGISNSEVIPEIITYQKTKYSDVNLKWGVAKDGYDSENLKIIR